MPEPDAPDAHERDRQPPDAIPGLAAFAGIQADAIVATDLGRRVLVWNRAAEGLYGIAADDALGRTIEELFDTVVIGEGATSGGARRSTLERGSWRGRIADRPRIGRRVGTELVIDAVLNRLDGPDGEPIGVMSVNRDITESVRIERELATLGTLSTATGDARSQAAFAERALEVVAGTTGAQHGAIVLAEGRAGRILAGRGLTPGMTAIADVPWVEAPAIRAVTAPGRVVKGAVDRLPMAPDTRRAFLGSGIRTMLITGLHRDESHIGVLVLGWDQDEAATPSDAVTLLIGSTITRGLDATRLMEDVARRADAERTAGQRIRALNDLTRVTEQATIDDLARRSAEIVNVALGAVGTAYGVLDANGAGWATTAMVDVRPEISAWLRENPPDQRSAFRRWRLGEGPFLEAFEPGGVSARMVELARQAGVSAYAAIPIRVEGRIVGGIAAYFDRPIATLGIDRDVLDRVANLASIALENWRLRERLAGSEHGYRTLFERSPDALIVERLDGTMLDVNDAATRTYRAPREWLIGRPWHEVTAPDAQVGRSGSADLAQGESVVVRSTGMRRGGDTFPEEVEILRVDLEGEPRLLVRVRDLTDQERLRAELIQAQKMDATGQLVSGVAHELNNPLASILGFSELIRRDGALPADLRRNADLLVEEATRTRQIVQTLLDFARLRPPERVSSSIRALIESVLTLQGYQLRHGVVDLEVDVPDGLPPVELDRGGMQQVLVNLIQNAVHAIEAGGGSRLRIAATADARGERVRITVMDDGVGIPATAVPRLFDAFYTTKLPGEGTGLGLPVSYDIVASHGGTLRYAPASWGRGAAFTVDLPVRAARPGSEPPGGPQPMPESGMAVPVERRPGSTAKPSATETAGSGPPPGPAAAARARILVLDDEPSIRVFLDKALRALGHDPVVTATAAEAVDIATGGAVAAVLCDHQMAQRSGVEVFADLVAARPELADRFVLMSGDVLNPALAAFAEERGLTLLAKPFDLATLDRTVRSVLDRDPQPRG